MTSGRRTSWFGWGLMGLAGAVLITAVVATVVRADAPGRSHQGLFSVDPYRLPDPQTQAGQVAREALHLGRRHTASPLIIPNQILPGRFSHEQHLTGGGLGCTDCHTKISNSVRSADQPLPAESTCTDCHDFAEGMTPSGGDPPSRCSTCHPGYVPRFLPGASPTETHKVQVFPPANFLPPPYLKFNHKVHVDRGVQCASCHRNMKKIGFADRQNSLPTMGSCLRCHDGKKASAQCGTCHLTRPDGRVDTMAAGTPLEPAGWYYGDAHDDDFLKRHGLAAQADDNQCNACHTPKECLDCHNGVKRPLKIHPNNWVLIHPTAARMDSPHCGSCHRSQTFCLNCHEESKVVEGNPNVANDPNRLPSHIKFHPDGWVSFGARGRNDHSFAAERNITACTSCHTEQTCLTCHASSTFGGSGVSPHPPGFVSSGFCRRLAQRNSHMCQKCHRPQSVELMQCQ